MSTPTTEAPPTHVNLSVLVHETVVGDEQVKLLDLKLPIGMMAVAEYLEKVIEANPELGIQGTEAGTEAGTVVDFTTKPVFTTPKVSILGFKWSQKVTVPIDIHITEA